MVLDDLLVTMEDVRFRGHGDALEGGSWDGRKGK
jgi:hypothetical protein